MWLQNHFYHSALKMDISALKSKLEHYGQEHLLSFWDQLSEADQVTLVEDLESIDFAEMNHVCCFV